MRPGHYFSADRVMGFQQSRIYIVELDHYRNYINYTAGVARFPLLSSGAFARTGILIMEESLNKRFLNSFYYLAPLWFLVETFFWPNFRAGVVFGPGLWCSAGFYAVEAALGVALWMRLPYAGLSALAENVIYLIFVIKFILYNPIDIASSLASDTPGAEAMARNYVSALPGIIYSAAHVVLRIRGALEGRFNL